MPRSAPLGSISLQELERAINARRRELRGLERRRSTLVRKLEAVERAIDKMNGNSPRGRAGSRRARNTVSLPDAISNVLSRSRTAMGVGDIAEKVLAGGYRSGSANFRSMVNQALFKDQRFVSERRGVYRLRGSRKPANV
jgi:hypothetical protein